jgi:hypothetical protein
MKMIKFAAIGLGIIFAVVLGGCGGSNSSAPIENAGYVAIEGNLAGGLQVDFINQEGGKVYSTKTNSYGFFPIPAQLQYTRMEIKNFIYNGAPLNGTLHSLKQESTIQYINILTTLQYNASRKMMLSSPDLAGSKIKIYLGIPAAMDLGRDFMLHNKYFDAAIFMQYAGSAGNFDLAVDTVANSALNDQKPTMQFYAAGGLLQAGADYDFSPAGIGTKLANGALSGLASWGVQTAVNEYLNLFGMGPKAEQEKLNQNIQQILTNQTTIINKLDNIQSVLGSIAQSIQTNASKLNVTVDLNAMNASIEKIRLNFGELRRIAAMPYSQYNDPLYVDSNRQDRANLYMASCRLVQDATIESLQNIVLGWGQPSLSFVSYYGAFVNDASPLFYSANQSLKFWQMIDSLESIFTSYLHLQLFYLGTGNAPCDFLRRAEPGDFPINPKEKISAAIEKYLSMKAQRFSLYPARMLQSSSSDYWPKSFVVAKKQNLLIVFPHAFTERYWDSQYRGWSCRDIYSTWRLKEGVPPEAPDYMAAGSNYNNLTKYNLPEYFNSGNSRFVSQWGIDPKIITPTTEKDYTWRLPSEDELASLFSVSWYDWPNLGLPSDLTKGSDSCGNWSTSLQQDLLVDNGQNRGRTTGFLSNWVRPNTNPPPSILWRSSGPVTPTNMGGDVILVRRLTPDEISSSRLFPH